MNMKEEAQLQSQHLHTRVVSEFENLSSLRGLTSSCKYASSWYHIYSLQAHNIQLEALRGGIMTYILGWRCGCCSV